MQRLDARGPVCDFPCVAGHIFNKSMTGVSRVGTFLRGSTVGGRPGRSLSREAGLARPTHSRSRRQTSRELAYPLALTGALSRPPVPTRKAFCTRGRCVVFGHAVAPQRAWGLRSRGRTDVLVLL